MQERDETAETEGTAGRGVVRAALSGLSVLDGWDALAVAGLGLLGVGMTIAVSLGAALAVVGAVLVVIAVAGARGNQPTSPDDDGNRPQGRG